MSATQRFVIGLFRHYQAIGLNVPIVHIWRERTGHAVSIDVYFTPTWHMPHCAKYAHLKPLTRLN